MKYNIIYHKSCLPMNKEVDDETVDLILTDPPYYQKRAKNITRLKKHKDLVTEFEFDLYPSEEKFLTFIKDVLKECYRVTKKGASGYLFCCDDYVSFINRIIEDVGFQLRKVIHWHKTNPFPAIKTRKMFANSMELIIHFSKGTPKTWNAKEVNEMHNFIESPICMGKERMNHKTQKPLAVCRPYIEISSNENDVVLDPFMGTGTTAIACLELNRRFIGYEISSEYCKIIKKRYEQFLQKQTLFMTTPNLEIK